MPGIEILHDVDPYNHGATTVIRTPVVQGSPRAIEISEIISSGWGLKATEIQVYGRDPVDHGVRNFWIMTVDGNEFFLRLSRPTKRNLQKALFDIHSYLYENAVPVPEIVKTTSNESFISTRGNDYSLLKHIESELYDGSQFEMKQMAQALARFHKALASYKRHTKTLSGQRADPLSNHQALLQLEPYIARIAHNPETEADYLVVSNFEKILAVSMQVIGRTIHSQQQLIHNDTHPHNVLFSPDTKELQALIDFENTRMGPRAKDIALATHRFARTCGIHTERKNDIGIDIWDRARMFLDSYSQVNPITDEERISLPTALLDMCIWKIIYLLNLRFIQQTPVSDIETRKQFALLDEAALFTP